MSLDTQVNFVTVGLEHCFLRKQDVYQKQAQLTLVENDAAFHKINLI